MAERALQPPVKPEQTFRFSIITWVLDMRGQTDLLGKDLAELITRSVWKTQHPIMQSLPDWLILSHKQFDSLLDYTQPLEDGGTGGRIFITPHNVMEVDVDVDLDPVEDNLLDEFDQPFEYSGLPTGGRFSQSE